MRDEHSRPQVIHRRGCAGAVSQGLLQHDMRPAKPLDTPLVTAIIIMRMVKL
jgi:hypothetical protein